MAWTARPLPRRPLHPLAGEEDGEALASSRGHPAAGALRPLRRKGRKQKQVRGVGWSARAFLFVILFRWFFFFFLLRWLTMWVPPARAAAVAQDGAAEMAQHKVDGVWLQRRRGRHHRRRHRQRGRVRRWSNHLPPSSSIPLFLGSAAKLECSDYEWMKKVNKNLVCRLTSELTNAFPFDAVSHCSHTWPHILPLSFCTWFVSTTTGLKNRYVVFASHQLLGWLFSSMWMVKVDVSFNELENDTLTLTCWVIQDDESILCLFGSLWHCAPKLCLFPIPSLRIETKNGESQQKKRNKNGRQVRWHGKQNFVVIFKMTRSFTIFLSHNIRP
jgi:hypothetical protein